MGKEVYAETEEEQLDKETDPEVIARRHELYDKYVAPFYNMIYRLCIRYSYKPCNVQENYTEVLANFYRRIETYDPSKSIRTWLHIVTKRQIRAIEKRRQAHIDRDNDDHDIEEYSESIIDESTVSSNVMSIDNYRELYNDDILSVLDELKPIHRDAFLLQQAGYALNEIVEIEYQKGSLKSKNIETIKSRLFFARQYLQRNLTRDGERLYHTSDNEDICGDSD